MTAAGKLVEDDSESPNIGLDAGVAGNKLLGGHVADGAAACGVGGGDGRVAGQAGLGRIEARVFRMEPAGKAEVENLYQAAIGEHHVLRLEVAMKDAQRVRSLESVGDLDADGEHKLEHGGTARDETVERRPDALRAGWWCEAAQPKACRCAGS